MEINRAAWALKSWYSDQSRTTLKMTWDSTNRASILPVDETQICTTTYGQRGPGSNGNEKVVLRPPELEPHYQMLFSVILRTLCFQWSNLSAEYVVIVYLVSTTNWKLHWLLLLINIVSKDTASYLQISTFIYIQKNSRDNQSIRYGDINWILFWIFQCRLFCQSDLYLPLNLNVPTRKNIMLKNMTFDI